MGSALEYQYVDSKQLDQINDRREGKDAREVVKWAYETFDDDLVYACSFGAEAMVLIDLIVDIRPHASVVFLDTHLHFKETYELIDHVIDRYPLLNIRKVQPALSLSEQAEKHGDKLWRRDPDKCCSIRKLEPLQNVLNGYRAWMSGVRRSQSVTRVSTQYVNRDDRFKSLKICPLIHWSWDEVWAYIREHSLPYNTLHDRNYPSIGCEKCTLPVFEGQDLRAGRWAQAMKTECGLHR